MYTILHAYARTWVRRHVGRSEDGQAELILVFLLAFLIALLVTGRRLIVQ
ncbi:MAG: hypothetical protein QN178_01765 [Armatimonadota bacterium]|nr:hypothetical protein [Armatimonadota bacterium]